MKIKRIIGLLGIIVSLSAVNAASAEKLPNPTGKLTGQQIAEHVHEIAHGGLIDIAVSKRSGKDIGLVINRVPLEKRGPGRKPYINTFETYINNKPENPELDALQMAIITSGKIKGTGILYTGYADKSRSGTLTVWLPALRKIRHMNEPAHEDTWAGTNLTYGELVLRRPEHEVHELLGEEVFDDCLTAMKLEKWEMNRYTRLLPQSQCGHKGKTVFKLKSTTKFDDWWYDYHVSYIDKETYSVYRTVYFKGDEKIKTVEIDWQSLDQPDPRIKYPRYIYALTHRTGIDSMVYVPKNTISLNDDIPDSFWSEATLRKYGK